MMQHRRPSLSSLQQSRITPEPQQHSADGPTRPVAIQITKQPSPMSPLRDPRSSPKPLQSSPKGSFSRRLPRTSPELRNSPDNSFTRRVSFATSEGVLPVLSPLQDPRSDPEPRQNKPEGSFSRRLPRTSPELRNSPDNSFTRRVSFTTSQGVLPVLSNADLQTSSGLQMQKGAATRKMPALNQT